MVFHHVRKATNFLFNVLSGECCSEYLATAAFFEEDNLFDSLNGGTCVDHWKKASMGINSWIFLKDGKPAFF
jgi:hypothetical protein